MAGIEKTQELVALLPVVAEALSKSLKDGVLNVFDAPKFFPVIAAARQAFADVKGVPEEVKDLSKEELITLLDGVWTGVAAVVAAVTSAVAE